jgi:hypothetical protein
LAGALMTRSWRQIMSCGANLTAAIAKARRRPWARTSPAATTTRPSATPARSAEPPTHQPDDHGAALAPPPPPHQPESDAADLGAEVLAALLELGRFRHRGGEELEPLRDRRELPLAVLLGDAVLSRFDLAVLGYERRALDAIFRGCPVVSLPGYSRPLIRVSDYLAFLEASTYCGDRVRVSRWAESASRARRGGLQFAKRRGAPCRQSQGFDAKCDTPPLPVRGTPSLRPFVSAPAERQTVSREEGGPPGREVGEVPTGRSRCAAPRQYRHRMPNTNRSFLRFCPAARRGMIASWSIEATILGSL